MSIYGTEGAPPMGSCPEPGPIGSIIIPICGSSQALINVLNGCAFARTFDAIILTEYYSAGSRGAHSFRFPYRDLHRAPRGRIWNVSEILVIRFSRCRGVAVTRQRGNVVLSVES